MAVAPDQQTRSDPTDPLDHYRQHADVYDSIQQSLDGVRTYFLDADRQTQRRMLQQSVTFALTSTQTAVRNHEHGYLNVVDSLYRSDRSNGDTVQSRLRTALLDGGVNYYRNKASYIFHNLTAADTDRVIDALESGRWSDALEAVVREFKGVAMQKGGFTLANLGMPKVACLDTNTAQTLGVDPEDAYSGVVPEKYMKQWEGYEGMCPHLRGAVDSRYLYQWVLFSYNLGTIVTHDAYFLSLPEDVDLSHV
jgi:thermostable 8-oxoguanine DNA glycosylase